MGERAWRGRDRPPIDPRLDDLRWSDALREAQFDPRTQELECVIRYLQRWIRLVTLRDRHGLSKHIDLSHTRSSNDPQEMEKKLHVPQIIFFWTHLVMVLALMRYGKTLAEHVESRPFDRLKTALLGAPRAMKEKSIDKVVGEEEKSIDKVVGEYINEFKFVHYVIAYLLSYCAGNLPMTHKTRSYLARNFVSKYNQRLRGALSNLMGYLASLSKANEDEGRILLLHLLRELRTLLVRKEPTANLMM